MRLIDADALWKAITIRIEEYADIADIMEIIEMQPIIEERETERWIPVTEALPTTDDKVLCCTMTKKGVPGIVIGYYLRGEHGYSWACGMNSNVVAWMPLPKPYEGSK